MTPYAKAQQLLELIEAEAENLSIALPTTRYASTGTPVVACAEVQVAAQSLELGTDAGPVECNAPQLSTFQLIIARECANYANHDGTNNPEKVAEVSALIADDADLLWAVCNAYKAFVSKRWYVNWTITGNLGITTCTLITGVD